MARRCQSAGPPQPLEFRGRLAEAEIVKGRCRVAHLDRHGASVAGRCSANPVHQAGDPGCERRVAERGVHGGSADEAPRQFLVERGDGICRVGAVDLAGPLHAGAVAVPDLLLSVSRPHEEHEPLVRAGRIDHRDGVRLPEPRQEPEVGVLAKLVVDVVVANDLRRRRDDGETAFEPVGELGAPGRE